MRSSPRKLSASAPTPRISGRRKDPQDPLRKPVSTRSAVQQRATTPAPAHQGPMSSEELTKALSGQANWVAAALSRLPAVTLANVAKELKTAGGFFDPHSFQILRTQLTSRKKGLALRFHCLKTGTWILVTQETLQSFMTSRLEQIGSND